jgi:hypothetical protein
MSERIVCDGPKCEESSPYGYQWLKVENADGTATFELPERRDFCSFACLAAFATAKQADISGRMTVRS